MTRETTILEALRRLWQRATFQEKLEFLRSICFGEDDAPAPPPARRNVS